MLAMTLLGLLLHLGACGGDSPSCANPTCGGNLVGQWMLTGACGTSSIPLDACPQAMIQVRLTGAQGMLSVNQDMTYSQNLTLMGTGTANLPGTCLMAAQVTNCSQLVQVLGNNAGFTNVQCSGNAAQQCNCTFALTDTDNDAGTWTQNGNQVTVQGANMSGPGQTGTFCQQGNSLQVKASNSTVLTFSR